MQPPALSGSVFRYTNKDTNRVGRTCMKQSIGRARADKSTNNTLGGRLTHHAHSFRVFIIRTEVVVCVETLSLLIGYNLFVLAISNENRNISAEVLSFIATYTYAAKNRSEMVNVANHVPEAARHFLA